MATAEFSIFADFNQFVVSGEGIDWGDLYERWSPKSIDEMIVCAGDYIAVGTARPAHVPVIIRVTDTEPPIDAAAHRIQECELAVNSERLEVTGITDNGMSGGHVEVQRGMYKVRVSYYNLDSVDESGLHGHDHYTVELWKVS